jgi:hypothetical protein
MSQVAQALRAAAEVLRANIYDPPRSQHDLTYNAAMRDAADILISRANDAEESERTS